MKVQRREIKYMLNVISMAKMDGLLSKVLSKDPNCTETDYYIRSLYFDSINNHDFHSKMNGDESRKKIRLRLYDVESRMVKLEIKRKENLHQVKESVLIHRLDAQALMRGAYDVLLKYPDPVAETIHNIMLVGQYRPVVLVDYYRRAFVHKENDIRVTLDYDIRTSESNLDFFNGQLLLTPVFHERKVVLEIKFNNVFPKWITEAIGDRGHESESISKYCSARTWIN